MNLYKIQYTKTRTAHKNDVENQNNAWILAHNLLDDNSYVIPTFYIIFQVMDIFSQSRFNTCPKSMHYIDIIKNLDIFFILK